MRKTVFISILGFYILLTTACSGDASGTPVPPTPIEIVPTATTLIFPEDNTECNEGVILSPTESNVTFRWEAAEDTDSYQVNLRDLNTGETRLMNSMDNSLEITILRGNPYAWSVVSRSNSSTQTAESTEFRFYNAGVPLESFAPFPADVVSPAMGSTIDQGTIDLEWIGTDIDQDISSYIIFLDTENPPTTRISETDTSSIAVDINNLGVYFWSVITIDQEGNTSKSQTFQFKVD